MNQAEVSKLVSQLRIKVDPHIKKFRFKGGHTGRVYRLRQVVTGLFKHERIEANYTELDEARGYAERLISDAIRHGDTHEETMEAASYWLTEKQLVHKLFKVLAPRYQAYDISYTRMLKVSNHFPNIHPRAVLELRGNPYPPLFPNKNGNRNLIHNVLLEEAKKQFRAEKYEEIAKNLEEKAEAAKTETGSPSSDSDSQTGTAAQTMVEAETSREIEPKEGSSHAPKTTS
ncbi:hypothetical protein LSTR_LSTR003117 [Laodelphax striatellus]|uniref:Large ribosomal subunit protein bL17m n=1 Tax=Laodelphax striatellus TaxID=195883 RepID=A0A482WWI6_LAOST|nr:hypothetical protein LSTR_LSTR003117 [Laodelphax striatellus]